MQPSRSSASSRPRKPASKSAALPAPRKPYSERDAARDVATRPAGTPPVSPDAIPRTPSTPDGARELARLLDIMAQLRHPVTGCPWDLQQNLSTLRPYLIEEAYEVLDALEDGSREHLAEELGDLLLQIVFQARIAEEEGAFGFADVARGISDKMIRRHPHIFGAIHVDGAADVLRNWDVIKAAEHGKTQRKSVLDAVSRSAPPLHRAYQLQERAARVGFDWDQTEEAFDKLHEEVGELRDAIRSGIRPDIIGELGDVIFSIVNIARFVSCDPAYALTCTNNKFERRFRVVEAEITAQGRRMQDASLAEMEAIWDRQRAEEHAAEAARLATAQKKTQKTAKKPKPVKKAPQAAPKKAATPRPRKPSRK